MLFKNQNEIKNYLKKFDLDYKDILPFIKESLIIKTCSEGATSFVGGNTFFIPKTFSDSSIGEEFSLLFQIDLEELPDSVLPKTAFLTAFLYLPSNLYSKEDYDKPLIKLFYFPKNSDFQKASKTHFITEEKLNHNLLKVEKIEHEVSFPFQYISFENGVSLPKLDYHPDFEITDKILRKRYDVFESDMIVNQDKSAFSNFFGWSQNQQPISSELETMKKYYKEQSLEVVHLLTLSINLDLSLPLYMGPQSISIFLFKEDLEKQRFDRAWSVLCWD